MEDLLLLEKYDAVLDVLFSESGKAPTFQDIEKKLKENAKKIDGGEVWDILNTMMRDGYLYFVPHEEKNAEVYLISFNGKYLKETGGLVNKIEREKTKQKLDSDLNESNLKTGRWTRSNMIISVIIGSITLIAVLANLGITVNRESKETGRKLRDSLQEVKTQQNASQLNRELHQIYQVLQDTSKVKVKIER